MNKLFHCGWTVSKLRVAFSLPCVFEGVGFILSHPSMVRTVCTSGDCAVVASQATAAIARLHSAVSCCCSLHGCCIISNTSRSQYVAPGDACCCGCACTPSQVSDAHHNSSSAANDPTRSGAGPAADDSTASARTESAALADSGNSRRPPIGTATTEITSLPSEVLATIISALPDRGDRAAFAAAFSAARDAVASATESLRIPAAAFFQHPQCTAAAHLGAALRRRCCVTRLSVSGPVTNAYPAPPGFPEAAIGAFLSSLTSMRHLVRLELGTAPGALFERLPAPLLRALAACCPQLQELELSAHLWLAPVQAAVLRAMTRVMAAPPPPACTAAGCPSAACSTSVPPPTLDAYGVWGPPGCGGADAQAQYDAAASERQLQLATALLAQAQAAQAERENMACLGSLQNLTSLTVTGNLPPEVAGQLPQLPAGLARLSLNCALLSDDEALGRALGALTGLSALALAQLPSTDGTLFHHMTGRWGCSWVAGLVV